MFAHFHSHLLPSRGKILCTFSQSGIAQTLIVQSLSQKYKLGSQTFDPQEKNARIKANPRVLEAVFNLTKEGETVVVHFGESSPGHYAVVRLDKILSSHIPPFGEISDKVKKIWIQKAQAKKAVALGKQKLEEIRLGQIKDSTFRVLPGVSLSSKQAPAGVPEEVQTHIKVNKDALASVTG